MDPLCVKFGCQALYMYRYPGYMSMLSERTPFGLPEELTTFGEAALYGGVDIS